MLALARVPRCAPRPRRGSAGPLQRKVVVDQVDTRAIGIASADVLVESQYFGRGLGESVAAEQDVAMDVIGAEEVTDATSAHVRGASSPGSLALRVAMTRVG